MGLNRMVAPGMRGSVSGCVKNHHIARECNRRPSLLVVLVSVSLIVRAHALADHDRNLLVVGCAHMNRAVIVTDAQAGDSRWYFLFEAIVEVIGFTENVIEIAVVDVEVIPD